MIWSEICMENITSAIINQNEDIFHYFYNLRRHKTHIISLYNAAFELVHQHRWVFESAQRQQRFVQQYRNLCYSIHAEREKQREGGEGDKVENSHL